MELGIGRVKGFRTQRIRSRGCSPILELGELKSQTSGLIGRLDSHRRDTVQLYVRLARLTFDIRRPEEDRRRDSCLMILEFVARR